MRRPQLSWLAVVLLHAQAATTRAVLPAAAAGGTMDHLEDRPPGGGGGGRIVCQLPREAASELTAERWEAVYKGKQPVVLTHMASGPWTPAFLREKLGPKARRSFQLSSQHNPALSYFCTGPMECIVKSDPCAAQSQVTALAQVYDGLQLAIVDPQLLELRGGVSELDWPIRTAAFATGVNLLHPTSTLIGISMAGECVSADWQHHRAASSHPRSAVSALGRSSSCLRVVVSEGSASRRASTAIGGAVTLLRAYHFLPHSLSPSNCSRWRRPDFNCPSMMAMIVCAELILNLLHGFAPVVRHRLRGRPAQ